VAASYILKKEQFHKQINVFPKIAGILTISGSGCLQKAPQKQYI
jgi:hypothetical protein